MRKKVIVNDLMQQNYVYYLLEPVGKNFDQEFKPDLILDSGIIPESAPSTVVRVSNGEVEILRQGSIDV